MIDVHSRRRYSVAVTDEHVRPRQGDRASACALRRRRRFASSATNEKGRNGMCRAPLIVVVDDDNALRNSLDDLLESVGFRVQGFASAEAFLQAQYAPETACLLLDVRLPGMNGLELQRQLVAAHWAMPIIFVTAYADDDVRTRVLAAGAAAFLYKPCREEDLLHAIEAALTHA